jgi:hypothetical protein
VIRLDEPCCEEGNNSRSCQTADIRVHPSDVKQRDLLSLLAYSDFTSLLQNCTIQSVLQVTFIALDMPCGEGNDLVSCQIVSPDPSDAKESY